MSKILDINYNHFITWAGPRIVQELGTFLGPQNRTQRSCEFLHNILSLTLHPSNLLDGCEATFHMKPFIHGLLEIGLQ